MEYSRELVKEMRERIGGISLEIPWCPSRYEDGDLLELDITTAWPEYEGHAHFRVQKYVGGGFAGQVYLCRLDHLHLAEGAAPDLVVGGRYAVKILVPASRFAVGFRNVVYRLAFQSSFSARSSRAACRTGLLWPKVIRAAAAGRLGDEQAVADTYASFYDPVLRSWGEVREWVEGRTWKLEADGHMRKRRLWRSIEPRETGSPEYTAKRRFMADLVRMLHDMGMPELARQYEWWTMKSQPNVLKRSDRADGPGDGLCAVDFRAGLALVPCLPMSPADLGLVFRGLCRGSVAQFDRCDWAELRWYMADHFGHSSKGDALLDALQTYDREYRRSMPDLTHQGGRLLVDASLRRDVRHGLVDGYLCSDLVDDAFVDRLREGGARFVGFYLLGAVPFLGGWLRRLWGHRAWRRHYARSCSSLSYLRDTGRVRAADAALEWHRKGRVGETHARRIASHAWLYWLERLTVGLLPRRLHRFLTEPAWWIGAMRSGYRYVRQFLRDAGFREQWLRDQVESGHAEGMLDDEERDAILAGIKDPFIVTYLKSVGVHLATLPVTQIVSVTVGAVWGGHILATGGSKEAAMGVFAGTVAFFQVFPVSPGSLCRGFYVVYLMIRDRSWRDYVVAAPLSFLKYVGYLSFPLQMSATHPALSQFMAGRWATNAVHVVPVFGEKGALFEHMVFDLFFNITHATARWAGRHVKGLLDVWMILGIVGLTVLFSARSIDWTEMADVKIAVNALLLFVGAFLLPRVLIYPVMRRGRERRDPA